MVIRIQDAIIAGEILYTPVFEPRGKFQTLEGRGGMCWTPL